MVIEELYTKRRIIKINIHFRYNFNVNLIVLDSRNGGVKINDLSEFYPTRTPVWWARRGLVELDLDEPGVTGRLIVIRIWKEFHNLRGFRKIFQNLEKLMFKITGGPKVLRRPLDDMNSLLWELSNGFRTFREICKILDDVFAEHIHPVEERTAMALRQFESLGFIVMLKEKFDQSWLNGPGLNNLENPLPDPDPKLGLDWSPLEE